MLMALLWAVIRPPEASENITISEVASEIIAGNIDEISVGTDGRLDLRSGNVQTRSQINSRTSLEETLNTYGVTTQQLSDVRIRYERPSLAGPIFGAIFGILPLLLIGGFIFFMYRQSQGSNNQAMAFGKSRARMFIGDHPTVTFADVAGAEEAKEELQEVVQFLREPEKFVRYGARIPKGVLLVGSPGTGKTLLAKAVSGEAGVPFFSIAGSEFVEMFVGVGASRVRDLFEQATRHSPCIIFIDEIDAVGRHRGAGLGGGHDEREQTLNQILVEMDGFSTDTHIIMLAATNRPDILDPALMRPGRFDRRVIIDKPDIKGREEIFKVHMRGKPVSKLVSPLILAKSTPGFTGADIENTVNEAALLAARHSRPSISMTEFHDAIERVQLGPERRSRVITEEERELVAFHEAGHAVVAHYLPSARPIRKVTIVPRGQAGGVTWFLEDDTQFMTTAKCNALIATALGGRVAEELVFEDITTGAQNDLQQVTRIAQAMVTQFGMSPSLGLRVYGEKQEMVFLGREISEKRNYSEAMAEKIDGEVRELIDQGHKTAHRILKDHRDKLDLIANTLLDVETLTMEEFTSLMEGKPLPPPSPPAPVRPAPSSTENKSNDSPNLDMPPSPSPA